MNPVLIQLITTLIQFAMLHGFELVQEFQLAIRLLTNNTDPTPEDQAAVDAALEKANNALQNAIKAKVG